MIKMMKILIMSNDNVIKKIMKIAVGSIRDMQKTTLTLLERWALIFMFP